MGNARLPSFGQPAAARHDYSDDLATEAGLLADKRRGVDGIRVAFYFEEATDLLRYASKGSWFEIAIHRHMFPGHAGHAPTTNMHEDTILI
jgi:hypothetical protein